jgi:hypothetical protein
MRVRLLTLFLLLAGSALQPALAGGWGRHGGEQRNAPPQYRPAMPPAYAAPQRGYPAYQGQYPGGQYPGMSRGDAMQQAQRLSPGGRILAADPADNGYRVRVLNNGEVRSIYVPGPPGYPQGPAYGPPPGYAPPYGPR